MTNPTLAVVEKLRALRQKDVDHFEGSGCSERDFFRYRGRFDAFNDAIALIESDPELVAMAKRIEELEKDEKGNSEWIESLCSQLCKMEDVLGFKNDCHDKSGAWVPTIGPWLERVRDLLAAEGELGDVKEEVVAIKAKAAARHHALMESAELLQGLEVQFPAAKGYKPIKRVLEIIKHALDSGAGKPLLARLEEARWLLSDGTKDPDEHLRRRIEWQKGAP